MKRAIVLAAAAFLIAAPISFAQTTPPETPPATGTPPVTTPPSTGTPPATTRPPAAQPAPANPATPATPAPGAGQATPATPATPSANASDANPQGCRTRKAAGEACACLSDTSRVGVSTAHPDGHNVCVRE